MIQSTESWFPLGDPETLLAEHGRGADAGVARDRFFGTLPQIPTWEAVEAAAEARAALLTAGPVELKAQAWYVLAQHSRSPRELPAASCATCPERRARELLRTEIRSMNAKLERLEALERKVAALEARPAATGSAKENLRRIFGDPTPRSSGKLSSKYLSALLRSDE